MNKNFSPDEQESWVAWVRTSQKVISCIEEAMKAGGFPPLVWYDVLLELERAEEGKLRLIELGEKMLLKKFNVTRLIDRMEAEEYVRRVACDSDARGAYAVITSEGKKLRRAMWPCYRDAVRKYFLKSLSDKEIKALSTLLKKIQLNLD